MKRSAPSRWSARLTALLTLVLAGLAGPSLAAVLPRAQAPESPDSAPDGAKAADRAGGPAGTAAEAGESLADLELLRAEAEALTAKAAAAEGAVAEVLASRAGEAWLEVLEAAVDLADGTEPGPDDSAESGTATPAPDADETRDLLQQVFENGRELAGQVADAIAAPPEELAPLDQRAYDRRLFEALRFSNRVYAALAKGVEIAEERELEVPGLEEWFRLHLAERAESISILLELATREADLFSLGLKDTPDDPELLQRLADAQRRVRRFADSLTRITARMEPLGLATAQYDEQVLAATGAVTADVLKFEVLRSLVADWGENVIALISERGPGLLFQLFVFLLILFVFRKLAKLAERLTERALQGAGVHMSQLLRQMLVGMTGKVVTLLGVLIALSQLGISLGPLLAGLGIAGFVIGFALQDTLSNFASGLMILFYRPFDTGDVIEANGMVGRVSRMSLVNTTILTFDNQTLILPNNMIWQNVIKNITGQKKRRVDLVFGVSYDDDIPRVEEILREIVSGHDKILDEPETQIHLHELADSSVNFIVRPWVATDDYWEVYWDLMRTVKLRFDEEDISIPYPQRDVHLVPMPEGPPGATDAPRPPQASGKTGPSPPTPGEPAEVQG